MSLFFSPMDYIHVIVQLQMKRNSSQLFPLSICFQNVEFFFFDLVITEHFLKSVVMIEAFKSPHAIRLSLKVC